VIRRKAVEKVPAPPALGPRSPKILNASCGRQWNLLRLHGPRDEPAGRGYQAVTDRAPRSSLAVLARARSVHLPARARHLPATAGGVPAMVAPRTRRVDGIIGRPPDPTCSTR